MQNLWTLKALPEKDIVNSLEESLGVSELVATLLAQRGIETYIQAKKFFRPKLSDLYNPFLMKDMEKAVERLHRAISSNERILVYGDYDVDGTTAVSLMYLFLKEKCQYVEYYIPDRYDEGYGVSYKGIDYAKSNDFSLIVCLDCGVKAIEKVAYAKNIDIDFIICDHHRPGDKLPLAVAILDPKRSDCNYPFKELCGCGIGFKLAQAYHQKYNLPFEDLVPLLDLVVVSIAADIVPMIDENRVLSFYGLQQLNASPRIGLKSLMNVSNRKDTFNISDIIFGLAPRINAAGRIEHANKAVELLVHQDLYIAKEKADYIDSHNFTRRELDKSITQEALAMIVPDANSTVVCSEKWHKGVVGIVASRLIETHYRPTIVLTESNGKLTGSARSVSGFDIYDAIDACSDLLEQFGGHKYAAGLTLKKENLTAFIQRFEEVVSTTITAEMQIPKINIDLEMPMQDINMKTHRIIEQMAPFGPSNSRPVFMTKGIIDNGSGCIVGQDKNHLKLAITDSDNSKTLEGIGFGMSDYFSTIKEKQPFDVCFVLDLNEWNGISNLQLRIKDIRRNASL
ncbi:MAG: single-stranded-DNA-specific exonuclease RecJ [Flavobacteriales bacterium]|nr:single-stranded-DNA-specific exonuclease RecJ [Flavobacteriales bacterium]